MAGEPPLPSLLIANVIFPFLGEPSKISALPTYFLEFEIALVLKMTQRINVMIEKGSILEQINKYLLHTLC